MHCPQCHAEIPADAIFCDECGSRLETTCASCGEANRLRSKFCKKCGQSVTAAESTNTLPPAPETYTPKHLAEKILTSKSALEGERKQVTVLFADLKGSMELLADRDPEESRTLLNEVVERMMEAVHRYEGTVNNVMGDGIMATFGAPLAHEDHALRACYAALRMQDAVNSYSDEVQRTQGIPVMIRVGLNSGEVVVGSVGDDLRMDYTAVGQTTHLAARMEQTAKPGSIMVSDETHKLTEGFFNYRQLGPVRVKGLSEPIDAYELEGEGQLRTRLEIKARRGLVKFVGRRPQLEQMRHALDLAREGHGQIVGVVGEPGVGKSRLVHEFKIVEQTGCLVLEAFCVPHGKAAPYLPLLQLLKDYFQFSPGDDNRIKREKLLGRVMNLDRSLEDAASYLNFLLGLSEPDSPLSQIDGQTRRQRTFDAIKRLLLRESINQPLLVVFEDLHWLDRETQAFLDLLSDSVGSTKILLLINYRPEYEHRWTRKTYYNQVRLDPLGEKEARGLLEVLVGNAEELKPLKHLILEKTEGNPFFLEEVVQTLVESQALIGDPGNYRAGQKASGLEIPPTVQVALAARLDRLPEADKGLLQASSVIGRKFSLSLLKRVVDEPEEALYESLSRLQVAEFLYEQPALPEVEYTFKHALTQEVAYNSVLIKRREVLHDKTARAIEEHYRDQLEEHYADLAYHYRCSGNADKAIDYLELAGKQAVERSAYQDGINYLTGAIEQSQARPENSERKRRELRLQIALGTPLAAIKGPGAHELESIYTRAQELCEQVGERSQLFGLLCGLWRFRVLTETRSAVDIAAQMMTVAEKANEPGLLVEAHRTLGTTLFNAGEHTRARPFLEKAIQLYEPTEHRSHALLYGIDPKSYSLSILADLLWLTGYPDQALLRVEEAIKSAHDVEHPYSMVFALGHGTAPRLWCGDSYGARTAIDEMMAIADEYGFRHWLTWGRILRGQILVHENVESGIEEIRAGLDASRNTGNTLFRPYYLAFLSEAYRKTSQTRASQKILAEALEVVNRTGERWYEAELHRLTGMLSLKSDIYRSQDQREMSRSMICFRRALDVAHQQNARSLELRAAMGVSRLLHQKGTNDEARQMLSEIYGWFTEGFDTHDLKEARALLDELS